MTIEPARRPRGVAIPVVLLLGLLGFATARPARAERDRTWWSGTLVAGTGVEYSTGNYGDEADTEIWDVPLSVKYIFEEIGLAPLDEVEFKVSIPFRRIREPITSRSTNRVNRTGIGNLALRLGYFHVPRKKIWPIVGALARVRLETSSDEVGSDATDVSFALDVSNAYELGDGRYPRISPFARAGYRLAGSPGPGRERDDTWTTSVGATFRPIWDVGIGLAYDWGETTSSDGDQHEISPWISWRVTPRFRIVPYAVFGLSTAAVDYAAGVAFRVSLDVEGHRDVPIRAGGER
ncbi:MAG: hypothetical protein ACQGVK_13565 [Myxococcota bacterium]